MIYEAPLGDVYSDVAADTRKRYGLDTEKAKVAQKARTIITVYHEGILKQNYPLFRYKPDGTGLDLSSSPVFRYVKEKTGYDGATVTRILSSLYFLAQSGEIDPYYWNPKLERQKTFADTLSEVADKTGELAAKQVKGTITKVIVAGAVVATVYLIARRFI